MELDNNNSLNTNEGLVSIIMPTYKCGRFIEESIKSVQSQSYRDWELIVVDDCSRDGTIGVVQDIQKEDHRIHVFSNARNSGAAVSRNVALREAKGRWIAFLDSDDLWEPTKLEKQIKFMQSTGATFSCGGYACMNESGKPLHYAFIPPDKTDYKMCIRLSNPIGNLTVMYDEEALGKFEIPPIRKRNDFALWLQILKKTRYCYGMTDIIGTYRMGRKNSVSNNKFRQIKYHWQLYHVIEKHGVVRSLYEIICWAFVKGTGIGIKKIPISSE